MKRSIIPEPVRSDKEYNPSPPKKLNLSSTNAGNEEKAVDLNLYTSSSTSLGFHYTNQQESKDQSPEGEASFVYDLETTPEYGDLIRQLDELSINENEEGDEMQNKAIQLALEGKNIFLTGKAGTGKSWVTRKLRSEFITQKKNLHVTAPTGIAAIQSNGVTINSWGKFGIGEYYSDFDRMMSKEVRDKICKTDVLVIEEISMVNGHLFDVLECMIAIIRCYEDVKERISDIKRESGLDTNSKAIMSPLMLEMRWTAVEARGLLDIPPFGGLQVILVGDFYQLPPIAKKHDLDADNSILMENQELSEKDFYLKVGLTGSYAFESRTWQRMKLEQVELVQVHRQNKDDGLFDCLNAMRDGSIHNKSEHDNVLEALQNPLPKRDDGIVPTELHSKNANVDERNRSELAKLNEESINFISLDEVTFAHEYKEQMLRKYNLEDFGHMPALYASVMKPRPPQELIEARKKFSAIDTIMKDLLAKGDYGSIPPLGIEKDKLKETLTKMESDYERQSIVTPETFKDFIESNFVASSVTDITPNDVYQRYKRFDDQLQRDYHSLKEHADKHFFQKQCRVGQNIELKKSSQVMLLFNVDVSSGLANGSRGIIHDFIPIALYRDMLSQENKKREETSQPTILQSNSSTVGHCNTSDDAHERGPSEAPLNASNKSPHVDYSVYNVEPTVIESLKAKISNMTDLKRELDILDKVDESKIPMLPYVKFIENDSAQIIIPQPFSKFYRNCGQATRYQIPLTLAWAISIHKSQGKFQLRLLPKAVQT